MKKLITIIILMFSQTLGICCSCFWVPVEDNYKSSETVFTAEVLDLERIIDNTHKGYGIIVKLKLLKTYKDIDFSSDTISIKTGNGGGDCGFRFEIGREYLIFASMSSIYSKEGKTELTTTSCTHTGLLSKRSKEIEKIEKLK